jgi:hypothetical protein
MPAFLRPILARLIASVIAAFAAWLNNKYGVTLDAETTSGLVAVMLGSFGIVYALAHRLIDAKVNPTDAASPAVAKVEKAEVDGEVARSERLIREIDAEARKV